MQKVLDNGAIRLAVFIFLLIWFDLIIGSFFSAALVSALTTLVIFLIIKAVEEKRDFSKYSKSALYNQLSLYGNDYVLGLYSGAKPAESNVTRFAAYRFSPSNLDDVAAAYRKSVLDKTEKIEILCKSAPRNVRVYAATLTKPVTFIDAPQIYAELKKANALPALQKSTKPHAKINFKTTLNNVLAAENARYYMFSGVLLALMVYATPLKIYYIVLSSLSLILAVICKIKNG